jgi:hypothetical protein
MLILFLTIINFSLNYPDRVNEVPQHYSDILMASLTFISSGCRISMEIDRLFQCYSGPIYIFLENDDNPRTGWENTGYISEDEFPLEGTDVMIILNHIYPERSGIYRLETGGNYRFISPIQPVITRIDSSIVRINFSIPHTLVSPIYKIKFFVSEEGNWGDVLPDNGFINIDIAAKLMD